MTKRKAPARKAAKPRAKRGGKQYDNTNRGALFKNDRKESDNHPDYTGVGNLDGVEMFVNAWAVPKAERSARGPLIRLSFKRKDAEQPPRGGAKPAPAAKAEDPDDDIPF